MHPIRSFVIYWIPNFKKIKSEKFEAEKVKCRFLKYERTNYYL